MLSAILPQTAEVFPPLKAAAQRSVGPRPSPTSSGSQRPQYRRESDAVEEIDITIVSRRFEGRARSDRSQPPTHGCSRSSCSRLMGGLRGVGNYGVSRMNGGHGSRSHMALAPTPRFDAQFRRDAQTLLSAPVGTERSIAFSGRSPGTGAKTRLFPFPPSTRSTSRYADGYVSEETGKSSWLR